MFQQSFILLVAGLGFLGEILDCADGGDIHLTKTHLVNSKYSSQKINPEFFQDQRTLTRKSLRGFRNPFPIQPEISHSSGSTFKIQEFLDRKSSRKKANHEERSESSKINANSVSILGSGNNMGLPEDKSGSKDLQLRNGKLYPSENSPTNQVGGDTQTLEMGTESVSLPPGSTGTFSLGKTVSDLSALVGGNTRRFETGTKSVSLPSGSTEASLGKTVSDWSAPEFDEREMKIKENFGNEKENQLQESLNGLEGKGSSGIEARNMIGENNRVTVNSSNSKELQDKISRLDEITSIDSDKNPANNKASRLDEITTIDSDKNPPNNKASRLDGKKLLDKTSRLDEITTINSGKNPPNNNTSRLDEMTTIDSDKNTLNNKRSILDKITPINNEKIPNNEISRLDIITTIDNDKSSNNNISRLDVKTTIDSDKKGSTASVKNSLVEKEGYVMNNNREGSTASVRNSLMEKGYVMNNNREGSTASVRNSLMEKGYVMNNNREGSTASVRNSLMEKGYVMNNIHASSTASLENSLFENNLENGLNGFVLNNNLENGLVEKGYVMNNNHEGSTATLENQVEKVPEVELGSFVGINIKNNHRTKSHSLMKEKINALLDEELALKSGLNEAIDKSRDKSIHGQNVSIKKVQKGILNNKMAIELGAVDIGQDDRSIDSHIELTTEPQKDDAIGSNNNKDDNDSHHTGLNINYYEDNDNGFTTMISNNNNNDLNNKFTGYKIYDVSNITSYNNNNDLNDKSTDYTVYSGSNITTDINNFTNKKNLSNNNNNSYSNNDKYFTNNNDNNNDNIGNKYNNKNNNAIIGNKYNNNDDDNIHDNSDDDKEIGNNKLMVIDNNNSYFFNDKPRNAMKHLREEGGKNPPLADSNKTAPLSEMTLRQLVSLSSRKSGQGELCPLILKALLALTLGDDRSSSNGPKAKRSLDKMAKQAGNRTLVSTKILSLASTGSTVSISLGARMSPFGSSFFNFRSLSRKSVSGRNRTLPRNNQSIPNTKNSLIESTPINKKAVSTPKLIATNKPLSAVLIKQTNTSLSTINSRRNNNKTASPIILSINTSLAPTVKNKSISAIQLDNKTLSPINARINNDKTSPMILSINKTLTPIKSTVRSKSQSAVLFQLHNKTLSPITAKINNNKTASPIKLNINTSLTPIKSTATNKPLFTVQFQQDNKTLSPKTAKINNNKTASPIKLSINTSLIPIKSTANKSSLNLISMLKNKNTPMFNNKTTLSVMSIFNKYITPVRNITNSQSTPRLISGLKNTSSTRRLSKKNKSVSQTVRNEHMSTLTPLARNALSSGQKNVRTTKDSFLASTPKLNLRDSEFFEDKNTKDSLASARSPEGRVPITDEKESTLSFISEIIGRLGIQLSTKDDTTASGNGPLKQIPTTSLKNSITQLVDTIASFMKLSYDVIATLMKQNSSWSPNETEGRNPLLSEASADKGFYARLLSNAFSPVKEKFVGSQGEGSLTGNERLGSGGVVILTSDGARLLNVAPDRPSTGNQNATSARGFKALIALARSDRRYLKEWTDSVLAFLSKQSHHFMDIGIYERLAAFWPRSSLTPEAWTLRLAGYCAQIEMDERQAVSDSPPLFCPFQEPAECDKNAKYRDVTGKCNNLVHSLWGSANIPFRRQLKNAYNDGLSIPRTIGKKKIPLPSAKLVSNIVFNNNSSSSSIKKAKDINLFTVFFIQFVCHDITRFAMDIGDIGPVRVNCCLPDSIKRVECFPIFQEGQKEGLRNGSGQCLHFLRSMPTVPLGCQSHVREQINQVTSFVDASNVYGTSLQEMKELRLFKKGLMKMSFCGLESLPPTDRQGASECGINENERQFPCFYAGDPRVNENPALALVHVLWLREHNRIARGLQQINPHWNDTQVFEESKKIVSALMQNIVYNELLPLVIGFDKAKEFGLLSGTEYFVDYDPQTDPTIENGFAAAAFRFGHGMITDQFLFLAGCPSAHSKCSPGSIRNGHLEQEDRNLIADPIAVPPLCPYMTRKNVSTMFENVDVFHHSETELESLLRGLLTQRAEEATDTVLARAITERLFGHMDLMARNIQRGRDHGLPSYNRWREWCGLSVARNFHSKINGFVDHKMEVVQRFAQVYEDPEDVDLVIGGLTEVPIKGAILGPLFVCIIGRQFKNLKVGDRFWYESKGQFTQEQLREIRLMKASHILLNNAGIQSVPKFAFYKGSNDNPFITSIDQKQLELSFWKEKDEEKPIN